MLDPNWESMFPPNILLRGYRYFENGQVTWLKPEKSGWNAKVEGSQEYQVFVSDDVSKSFCDCPYFFDHGFCKHIAAACYEIEFSNRMIETLAESPAGKSSSKRRGETPSTQAKASAEDILKALSSEKQLEFLLEIIRSDSHWEEVAVHRFGELDECRVKAEFVIGVEDVVHQYAYRGFVDYRSAYRCEKAFREYIDDFFSPLMERGAYDLVLQLTFAFELLLPKIATDDPDDFFDSMIDLINGYWSDLLAAGDPDVAQELFEWLCDLVRSENEEEDEEDDDYGAFWHLQSNARDRIEASFATKARFAEQAKELADEMLRDYSSSDDEFLYFHSYDQAQWAVIRLRCMMALGSPFSDLEEFADKRPPSYVVYQVLVKSALRRKDDNKAISLLRRFIERREGGAYPTDAALDLLKLLDKHNKNEDVVDLYLDLISKGRAQNTDQLRSWIRKARKRSGENWPLKKDELITRLGGDYRRLAELYDMEGDLSDLMELIREHGSFYDLQHYESSLSKAFPHVFLSRYEALVREQLFGSPAKRGVYRESVGILRRMQQIPRGAEIVAKIVKELREAYPRRKALMEELDRLP